MRAQRDKISVKTDGYTVMVNGYVLSDAVNMFLKQVVLRGGLPFDVRYPEYKPEVIEAMDEA